MGRFSLPDEAPGGLDSPVTAKVMKYGARAQVAVFRLTGGRVGSTWRVGAGFRKPVPTLLLEHRGRKSGRLFTTPLLYLRSGDDVVLVGSQGGLPKHPQWYFNLIAHPETRIHLKGRRDVAVTARVAGPHGARRPLAAAGRAVRRLREIPGVDRAGNPGRGAQPAVGPAFSRSARASGSASASGQRSLTSSRAPIRPMCTLPALDSTVTFSPAPWKTGPSG